MNEKKMIRPVMPPEVAEYVAKDATAAAYFSDLKAYANELERDKQTLADLSFVDDLTEIPNRRALMERAESLWGEYDRHGTPFSILMMDIDWFKRYNDAHGHVEGDNALISVAQMLKRQVRDRTLDIVARYGGEEFTAVLSYAGINESLAVANRILRATSKLPTLETVSLSIGVCPSSYPGIESEADMIKHADSALYLAKHTGRGRVCTVDELPEKAKPRVEPRRQPFSRSSESD